MKGSNRLSAGQVHKELAAMLEAFADYCEKHGLRYYLVGGTLLGAVRHKGFIPWDDDIDVGMPRPDYERFLTLVKDEPIAAHLKVISSWEGTFALPYADLLHTGIFLERETADLISEEYRLSQLFLDIIPQDGWPASNLKSRWLVLYTKVLRRLNLLSREAPFSGSTRLRALVKLPGILLAKGITNRRIVAAQERIAKKLSYDRSRYVGCVVNGFYGAGERCVGKVVRSFERVTFEGREYPAPGGYKNYLESIYGDYLTLPEESRRKTHRFKAHYVNRAKNEREI